MEARGSEKSPKKETYLTLMVFFFSNFQIFYHHRTPFSHIFLRHKYFSGHVGNAQTTKMSYFEYLKAALLQQCFVESDYLEANSFYSCQHFTSGMEK